MPQHIEHLTPIARHRDDRTGRTTWTAAGRLFTGRGAHVRALAAARAACRLAEILASVHAEPRAARTTRPALEA